MCVCMGIGEAAVCAAACGAYCVCKKYFVKTRKEDATHEVDFEMEMIMHDLEIILQKNRILLADVRSSRKYISLMAACIRNTYTEVD